MKNSRLARERADSQFRNHSERHEKGSAMSLIKAEAEKTQEKIARLKALRIMREEAEPEVPAKAKPAARKSRARRSTPARIATHSK